MDATYPYFMKFVHNVIINSLISASYPRTSLFLNRYLNSSACATPFRKKYKMTSLFSSIISQREFSTDTTNRNHIENRKFTIILM